MSAPSSAKLQQRTIDDFGEQWTAYQENDGYYGSPALFDDVFAPFFSTADLRDRAVAEIGAGTGRFIAIFLEAGARHVTAIEPSAAFTVLERRFAKTAGDRVTLLRCTGERIPQTGDLDFVFSIGVLHHIPEPHPVCVAARGALRPGGTFGVWLYGREGNGAYLLLFSALHRVTKHLPHAILAAVAWILGWGLDVYIALCRVLPLPLAGYMRRVMARLTRDKRRLVIYDQLNPAYAKYYSRAEAIALLQDAGFVDVRCHHRHGYSWTVVGVNP